MPRRLCPALGAGPSQQSGVPRRTGRGDTGLHARHRERRTCGDPRLPQRARGRRAAASGAGVATQGDVDRRRVLATADPETLLFTGALNEEPLAAMAPRFLDNELGGQDVNTFSSLVRSPGHVRSLDTATRAERMASARYRD